MSDPTISVLSTRPLSPLLIAAAADRGITIDVIPFIVTETVDDASLAGHIGELGQRRLVAVFTSTSAVEAIAGWTRDANDWTIFCIGSATRRLVESHFGEGRISGTAESALALASTIIRSEQPEQELFFFCGDQRREELPSVLRQAGFRVNELVVYRTIPTPQKTERSYAGIVFFSPSAVESFFSVNTLPAEATLFAIGRTTAGAIGEHCTNTIVISEQPDAAVLIRQMTDHFKIKNSER